MGTRIHKTLGWGFKYYRVGLDPRFNPEFFKDRNDDYLPQMLELASQDAASEDFATRWGGNDFLREIKEKKVKSIDSYDVFKVNGYASNGDISSCIFTDPLRRDWSRYDDIIDYYDSDSVPEDNVKFILDSSNQPAHIYPYCCFVNRHTGKHVSNIQSERWWVTELYFKRGGEFDWSGISETWGVSNIIQWQRDIVPDVPYNIKLFFRVAKPFKNPLTMYRLKPMIYTYWC